MRRTKEDAEQTKQAILTAAVDVFFQYGLTKASLERIAKAANVTRGAIYWHFKNKMEIYEALYDSLHQPFIAAVLEGLNSNHDDPIGQLKNVCIQLFDELEENKQRQKLITLFMFNNDNSEELKEFKEKLHVQKDEKLAAFTQYIERAKRKGQLSEQADPLTITVMIISLLRGIVLELLDSNYAPFYATKVHDMLHMFFNQLLEQHKE